MKWQQLKQWVCQLLLVCFGFFLLALASAAAQGSFPIPAALGLGLVCLLAMNALCGLLAPKPAKAAESKKPAAPKAPAAADPHGRRAALPTGRPVLFPAVHSGRAA